MRILMVVMASLLFSLNAFAADDATNKANFEKECAAMIAPGGPCGDVVAGGGGEEEDASANLKISRKPLPVAKQLLKNGGECRRSNLSTD